MKFHIIPIVNFQKKSNLSQDIIKRHLHSYSLINQDVLFKNLLKPVSYNMDLSKCKQQFQANQLSASLYFDNYKFRKRYLNWIYSHYSDSAINHQRIHRSEAATLVKGIRQFNKNSRYLKFVQITPDVDDAHFQAKLRLSGTTLTNHTFSSRIEDAVEDEYHLDKTEAFYQFEKQVGQYLINAFQNYFKQCIPGFPFGFSEAYLDIDSISNLKPLKSVKKAKSPAKINEGEASSKNSRSKNAFGASALSQSSGSLSQSVSSKSINFGALSSSSAINSINSSSASSGSSSSIYSSSNSSRASSSVSAKASSVSSMKWSSGNGLVGLINVVAKDVNENESKASSSSKNKKSKSISSSSKNVTSSVSSSSNLKHNTLSHSVAHSNKSSSSVSYSQKSSSSESSSNHVQSNQENKIKSSNHSSGLQVKDSSGTNSSHGSRSNHTARRSSSNDSRSSNESVASTSSLSSANAVDNKSASGSSSSANNSLVSHLIANSEIRTDDNHSRHYMLWTLIIIVVLIIIIVAIVIGFNII